MDAVQSTTGMYVCTAHVRSRRRIYSKVHTRYVRMKVPTREWSCAMMRPVDNCRNLEAVLCTYAIGEIEKEP